jgi:hypothetical protein
MNRKRLIAIVTLVAIIIFAAVPVLSGCGKVAEFSDPIVENILVSMNNSDYAGFSKDFDESMKAELNADNFDDFMAQVNGAVGNYIVGSKDLIGVNINNDLTTSNYTADFEGSKDVNVEVTFKKIGDEMKVVGLWFK